MFDLAKQDKKLDRVQADLAGLTRLMGESPDLKRVVESPVISRADQVKAITAVAERAGLDGLTKRLLGLMASHRRLFALPGVAKAYAGMLAAERGEVAAEIVSAVPLGAADVMMLEKAIAGFVGQAVSVETRVDPALLGGVVVRVGSRMLDASLRTKLMQLEQVLKGSGAGVIARGSA